MVYLLRDGYKDSTQHLLNREEAFQ